MQTKINKDREPHIPASGNLDSLFQRLKDYISVYDREWIRRIKPAAVDKVCRIRVLCGMENNNIDFPESYQIFLKYMGGDDGGLVSIPLLGYSSVDDLIKMYGDLNEYDKGALDNHLFTFFYDTIGAMELSFQIDGTNNPPIVETVNGEVVQVHSENMEKFLFQCAFQLYGKHCHYVEFCGSSYSVGRAIQKENEESVFNIVERFVIENQYQKAWISDDKHYIGYSEHVSFLVCHFDGVFGYFSADDEYTVKSIADVLMKRIGAEDCLS